MGRAAATGSAGTYNTLCLSVRPPRCKFFSLTETPEDYTIIVDEEGFLGKCFSPQGLGWTGAGSQCRLPAPHPLFLSPPAGGRAPSSPVFWLIPSLSAHETFSQERPQS